MLEKHTKQTVSLEEGANATTSPTPQVSASAPPPLSPTSSSQSLPAPSQSPSQSLRRASSKSPTRTKMRSRTSPSRSMSGTTARPSRAQTQEDDINKEGTNSGPKKTRWLDFKAAWVDGIKFGPLLCACAAPVSTLLAIPALTVGVPRLRTWSEF